ncbi:MAG: hypothetical protein KGQ57_21230 [Burkholderiales bacterium]|nr:hypothetical protein [Burkholderiales bacterium]
MTTPNRIAYFKPEKAVLSQRTEWKKDLCKPLNNPQAHVLMDKPPAGWTPPHPPPKAEEPKIDKPKIETAPDTQLPEPAKSGASTPSKSNEDDDCRTPPPFDMLDIPGAMKKMGFSVAAKLAQRWFDGREYVLSDDPKAEYPSDMVDTKDVTLSFVLGYKKVKAKYDRLIRESIYSSAALGMATKAIHALVERKFIADGVAFTGNIDTLSLSKNDIQDLHRDFQFQLMSVSSLDTLSDSYGSTDLTASLANFNLMAAIANASVRSEKYYNYDAGAPVFCCKSSAEITHIYVYAKDSYSFADKSDRKSSQYLGHWNRYGIVMVPAAVAADFANGLSEKHSPDVDWGDYPDTPTLIPYIYDNGFKKPVDILNGLFRDLRKKDVYYPIHNSDYNAWRKKFKRGGDFAIYTEMKKIKLQKSIKFSLNEICKPSK